MKRYILKWFDLLYDSPDYEELVQLVTEVETIPTDLKSEFDEEVQEF